jgi:hypothetical protein
MSRWDSRPVYQGISLELVQSFLEEKGFDVAVQDREGRTIGRIIPNWNWLVTGVIFDHIILLYYIYNLVTGFTTGVYLIITRL